MKAEDVGQEMGNCGSGLAREIGLSEAVMLAGPPSSRAGSLPEGSLADAKFVNSRNQKLWEAVAAEGELSVTEFV
ncbi:hypothetical protein BSG18_50760 [Pseudomonas ogarae]|nr:hypothetical protein BSG18_50760 [Pseudomonas ogarae]